jgi:hypothetical protein
MCRVSASRLSFYKSTEIFDNSTIENYLKPIRKIFDKKNVFLSNFKIPDIQDFQFFAQKNSSISLRFIIRSWTTIATEVGIVHVEIVGP